MFLKSNFFLLIYSVYKDKLNSKEKMYLTFLYKLF